MTIMTDDVKSLAGQQINVQRLQTNKCIFFLYMAIMKTLVIFEQNSLITME